MERFRLDGRTAIVTGGTGHLGGGICEALARAGADVAVLSTSEERGAERAKRLAADHSVEAAGFEADLEEVEEVERVVAEVADRFGGIDVLVNNAYFGAMASLEDMTPEAWARGLDGALSSCFFMLQACLPHLRASSWGAVVNVGSMYGVVSPDPSIYRDTPFGSAPSYGAGKAGLIQLTRYAAVYLAEDGIRVNAVSPGPFPAPGVREHREFIGRLEAKVPLRRIGRPEEVGGAIVFLASDAASYVTGHNLMVDGGWTASR